MEPSAPIIQTCVNCRHLQIMGVGREFEKIVDTEYTDFKCAVLGWHKKEFYLMSVPKDIMEEARNYKPCAYWEEWSPEL